MAPEVSLSVPSPTFCPPPPPAPAWQGNDDMILEKSRRRPRRKFLSAFRECPCCSSDYFPSGTAGTKRLRHWTFLDQKPTPSTSKEAVDHVLGCLATEESAVVQLKAPEIDLSLAHRFFDTHCHLEEVLQIFQRRKVIPSLSKSWSDMTPAERGHWRALSWTQDQWEVVVVPIVKKRNVQYDKKWESLSPEELAAAIFLGWDEEQWSSNHWPVPHGVAWDDLEDKTRRSLEILGEDAMSWENWKGTGAIGGKPKDVGAGCGGDFRDWHALEDKEQIAAKCLGFTQSLWDFKELHDIHHTIDNVFGAGFDGCLTQGCCEDSLDFSVELALAHPKVFVSIGWHPKGSMFYTEEVERSLLAALDRCGKKAIAWGEFGLDYSHSYYGRLADHRRMQRQVFARQLRLAVSRGLPLVLHIRGAERDALRIMRRFVPQDYKVHVHSFLGRPRLMNAWLREWSQLYIGFSGTLTQGHDNVEELCQLCPLDRTVLETDSPYMPPAGWTFAHPGHVVDVARKVAELKGVSLTQVYAVTRKNTKMLYGV